MFDRLLFVTAVLLQFKKPCHCHILLTICSKIKIHIYRFIPRCPYYTVCFAFRRTGIHPPKFL